MNQAKTTLMIAAIALAGISAPLAQQAEATMIKQEQAEQMKKDRAFAEKVRALKDRQHDEWQALIDGHVKAKAEHAELPDTEKKALMQKHDEEKLAMKERHRAEMDALKVEYKG